MRFIKLICFVYLSFSQFALAHSQEMFQFKFDIMSTSSARVYIDYVILAEGEYITTRLASQPIIRDLDTRSFEIPLDFKDLKIYFLSSDSINEYHISNFIFQLNGNVSRITNSELEKLVFLNELTPSQSDSLLSYSSQNNLSSIRFNYSKLTPFLYELKGMPFQTSILRLKLNTNLNCRMRIYYGSSLNKQYPFSSENFVYENISPSDSLTEIAITMNSTFDIDLLRIDFDLVKSPLLIRSVIMESKSINRKWQGVDLLNDFINVKKETHIDFNKDSLILSTNNDYVSLVTDKALLTDKEIEYSENKKTLINVSIILAILLFIRFNKIFLSDSCFFLLSSGKIFSKSL